MKSNSYLYLNLFEKCNYVAYCEIQNNNFFERFIVSENYEIEKN